MTGIGSNRKHESFGQKGEEENDAGVGIEEERGEVFVGQVE